MDSDDVRTAGVFGAFGLLLVVAIGFVQSCEVRRSGHRTQFAIECVKAGGEAWTQGETWNGVRCTRTCTGKADR